MTGFVKIPARQARARRPERLPPVEHELQVAPPRPRVWTQREWSAGRHTRKSDKLLVHGLATRAWVTAYNAERDREATDHFVQFAFQAGKKIVQGRFVAGYDDLHLGYGSPDYASWLKGAFRPGGTFTVLYDSQDPAEHVIYGTLELYLKKTLLEAARDLARNKHPADNEHLARRFLEIALAPLGVVGDEFEEYYGLLVEIGLEIGKPGVSFDKNLLVVRNLFDGGWLDRRLLSRLSGICKKYQAGVWAAT